MPFNFFTIAWLSGTSSIVDNAGLVKRVPFPKEIIPLASVFSNTLHLFIQIALLLAMSVVFGAGVNRQWFWLPVILGVEIVLLCGMALIFSAINVYTRDTRYVVESASTLLFWLIPIVYQFPPGSESFTLIYNYNPLAAVVFALRLILQEATPPPASLVWRLSIGSVVVLAAGFVIFNKLKRGFYNHI